MRGVNLGVVASVAWLASVFDASAQTPPTYLPTVGCTGYVYGNSLPNPITCKSVPPVPTLPFVSVMTYGASGSNASTTGSITSGSNQLTVANTIDFAVGQGVRVMGAGPSNISAPVGITGVTVQGTAGTTNYQYEICSLGYAGSISTCVSASASTGPNSFIASSNGLTYYGSTNNYVQIGVTQGANSSGYVVYRGVNGATPTLWSVGFGSTFKDQGLGWTSNGTTTGSWNGPGWFPTSFPSSASADWFVGTITAISGNVLTLSAAVYNGAPSVAANSVFNAAVYHDDTSAFNNAVSASASTGGNIQVPCGTFNTSYNVFVTVSNVGFTGQGMCSVINTFGGNTLFQVVGPSFANLQRSNFIQNLYITQFNQHAGFIVSGIDLFNFSIINVQSDHPAYGYNFLNTNTVNAYNDYIFSGTRGVASIGLEMLSDNVNLTCCLNAVNFYIHGNGVYTGNTGNSIGGLDKYGYVFDGNTATIYTLNMASSNIEGTSFGILNDTGNTAPPTYLTFISASCEFPNNRCVNIFGPGTGSGPSDIYFTDSTLSAAQNGAPIFITDASTSRVTVKGGKIFNGSCRGADLSGSQITFLGVDIGNNSTSTLGTCDGLVLETSIRGATVSGNQIGDPFNSTAQRYPVVIVNGADYFNVSGNSLYGNVTNCVNNGSTTATSRLVVNNAGSC